MTNPSGSSSGNSASAAPRLDQLPYYREYLDQILRPRVAHLVEGLQAELQEKLREKAWTHVLARMAQDQNGALGDVETLRAMLEDQLGLRIRVNLAATFDGAAAGAGSSASGAAPRDHAPTARMDVDVVERRTPENPLVRAVSGLRRADR